MDQMEFEDRPSATYFLVLLRRVQRIFDMDALRKRPKISDRVQKNGQKHEKRSKLMTFFDIIVGKDHPHNVYDVENEENDFERKGREFEGVSFPACRHKRK